jgi:hypothetical protein
MTRPTVKQLYNAGVLMNIAEGTSDHDDLSARFVDMFQRASLLTRVAAGARLIAWRHSPTGRWMRGQR